MDYLQDWTLYVALVLLGVAALIGAVAWAVFAALRHQQRLEARQEREALRQYREWLARSQTSQ